MSALATLGFRARSVSVGRDVSSPEELNQFLRQERASGVPILAGPLNSVTHALARDGSPVIGLSWGYDIVEMNEVGSLPDLTWIQGLIVDSQFTQLLAMTAGFSREQLTMLPWGVDLDLFTPVGSIADLSRWSVPSTAPVILSARAHEDLYRIADIIDSFAAPDMHSTGAHLLIAHSGSLTSDLVQQAESSGISDRIHFIGQLDENEIPAVMRACDVYVTASTVDGSSVTLLQAMACGLPVVASNTDGNAAWVQDFLTGRLFEVSNPPSLASVLAQTIRSPDGLMSERALHKVRTEADWFANLARLRSVIATAMG